MLPGSWIASAQEPTQCSAGLAQAGLSPPAAFPAQDAIPMPLPWNTRSQLSTSTETRRAAIPVAFIATFILK